MLHGESSIFIFHIRKVTEVKHICIMILLCPPRCGHCKQFAPEYEKIAQTLKENDPPIPVAKVDATVAGELAKRFEVSGYPTIKIDP